MANYSPFLAISYLSKYGNGNNNSTSYKGSVAKHSLNKSEKSMSMDTSFSGMLENLQIQKR